MHTTAMGPTDATLQALLARQRHDRPEATALEFEGAIDGELLVLKPDASGALRVQPFADLQQRLNRKTVDAKQLQNFPAAIRAYDLLADEKVLIVQGTGFNWATPDHFRIVFLPNSDDLTEAIARMKRFQSEKQPFFLAVGLYRPHTPYVAPKSYFDLYPVAKLPLPTVPDGYEATLPAPALKTIRVHKEQINLDPALARQAIQAYHASISFADAQIGRILDALT